ncbi:MAG: hypothetical protein ACK4PR_02970 [Gammaproteobacteria bacterium]
MQKTLLTCALCLFALSACGSGDKNKNNYQPNSKINVINTAQMTDAQQAQDFPNVNARPTPQQYAAADNTGATPPSTMSDTDDVESGSLAAMNTGAQPAPMIPSGSNPLLPTPTSPTAMTTPVTNPVTTQPITMPVSNPVTTQSTTISVTNPVVTQPSTMSVNNPVTTQSTTIQKSKPVVVQPVTSTPVIGQYQSLAAPQTNETTTVKPHANSYSNFDNLAIPVTFSNSPYNQALKTYNENTSTSTTEETTTTTPKTQNSTQSSTTTNPSNNANTGSGN